MKGNEISKSSKVNSCSLSLFNIMSRHASTLMDIHSNYSFPWSENYYSAQLSAQNLGNLLLGEVSSDKGGGLQTIPF
jgi:hypothetical protein